MDSDDMDSDFLIKVEWARPDCDMADYSLFIIDDGFTPDLFSLEGLRQVFWNKEKRFKQYLAENQPYKPKCGRISGYQKFWYLYEKNSLWHDNHCKNCPYNLITEYRKGNQYRKGGVFYYCRYPTKLREDRPDLNAPSIRIP